MNSGKYEKVCYWTEQRDENVPVQNLKNGQTGYTFGCTSEGETLQVRLADGSLDSWNREECIEAGSGL
ncbi:MAG: hypothetical protein HXX17_07690 [Geobacteraceae bacterium]|nr:hypothetical protein [Geobacteraceae bacterium]